LKDRCTRWLAGAAAWELCALAAAETLVYFDDFDSEPPGTEWNFAGVQAGSPVLLSTAPEPPPPSTRFLAEFGGDDAILLSLDLPAGSAAACLRFDAYLTWDGSTDTYSGPAVFGYEDGAEIVQTSFSNGAGLQMHEDLPNRVIDESWGLDNVRVTAQLIPEPQTAVRHRHRLHS
jgi:hypothetical protein